VSNMPCMKELRRSIPIYLRSDSDLRYLLEAIKRAELDTATVKGSN
jgi:hypothetical protein